MPRFFHPRRSDAHRLACLSLYRALLKQCSNFITSVPSPQSTPPLAPLHNLIRYRFRCDRRLQSAYAIQDALRRGQTHLHLLHDATHGSPSALKTLLSTFETAATHAATAAKERVAQQTQTKPPPAKLLPKVRHHQNEATKALHVPGPGSVPLTSLPLPLPQLKQPKRQVPYLNEVQGRIAILRWPGQHRYPVFVSRVMRQKLQRVEKLHEQRIDLEYGTRMGDFEDIWDEHIRLQLASELGLPDTQAGSDADEDDLWQNAPRHALGEQEQVIKKMESERGEQGRRIWELVKKEKKLSQWETLPERAVRAAINARKLHYKLVGIAKRLGRDDLAGKVYNRLQELKEVEAQQKVELMSMYWVIPVEWVKDIEPVGQPHMHQPSRTGHTGKTRSPRTDGHRGTAIRRRRPADLTNIEALPATHPRKERPMLAFQKALDTVKLMDFGNGGKKR